MLRKSYIIAVSLSVLLLSVLISSFGAKQDPPPGFRIRTIVLDPGHGGQDIGAPGTFSKEKDVVLQVALKLGKAIEESLPDVKVLYTRSTDTFVELYKRTEFANKNKADLFISIHCNSVAPITKRVVSGYRKNSKGKRYAVYRTVSRPNTVPKGTETFVSGFGRLGEQDVAMRENASILLEENYQENYEGFDPKDPESLIIFSLMKNQYREQSIKLAVAMQDQYNASGRTDRGVKEQSLAVLARAGMPSVLTELGFMSNPEEERYLNSEEGQRTVVNNLLHAIKTYKKQVEK